MKLISKILLNWVQQKSVNFKVSWFEWHCRCCKKLKRGSGGGEETGGIIMIIQDSKSLHLQTYSFNGKNKKIKLFQTAVLPPSGSRGNTMRCGFTQLVKKNKTIPYNFNNLLLITIAISVVIFITMNIQGKQRQKRKMFWECLTGHFMAGNWAVDFWNWISCVDGHTFFFFFFCYCVETLF